MYTRRIIAALSLALVCAASVWGAQNGDDTAFVAALDTAEKAFVSSDAAGIGAAADAAAKAAPQGSPYGEIVTDLRTLAERLSAAKGAATKDASRLAVYKEAEKLLASKDYPRTAGLLVDLCAVYPGDAQVYAALKGYHRSLLGRGTGDDWQASVRRAITRPTASAKPVAAAVSSLSASAMSDVEKKQRLTRARDKIVSQEFAEAEAELAVLKKAFPKDKEIVSLFAYVNAQKNAAAMKADAANATSTKEKKAAEDSTAAAIGSGTVTRDLFYEGVRLYNAKKFKDAGRRFKQVIDLEEGGEEVYAPRARKIVMAIEENIHKEVLGDILADEAITDEMMMRHIDENNTPPYLDPAKEKRSHKKGPMVELPEVRKKLNKVLSFDFSDIGLRHVVDYVSQETGVNIVLSQKVLEQKPKITAKFDDIAAHEALKFICKSSELNFRIDDDVLWIATNAEFDQEPVTTKIYRLKHGAGLLTEFTSSESSQAGVTSFASISKIETLEDTLKNAVDWPGGAKVLLDKRTNSLIVSNTPKNLQVIEEILFAIDAEPVQILVESKFIEVDITDLKELGAEWKFNSDLVLGTKDGSAKTALASGGGVDFTDFSNVAQGLNLTYKGVLTDPQFQLVIHALEKSDKTKALSSPRVTTLNNQLATMKVIDEWVYPTKYELQTTTTDLNNDGDYTDPGETMTENAPLDFVRRDVGIILKVVPSVGSDNKTITMSVIPEVSEATADYFEYSSSVKMPKFSSRNLATSVAVNSGETVVLGGLIKESRVNNKTKTPLLGDIPLLGKLFRKESESIQRRSLLIFVTARIISADGKELVAE
jgi:type II secretory pathway component GspD/PulD (secretin)